MQTRYAEETVYWYVRRLDEGPVAFTATGWDSRMGKGTSYRVTHFTTRAAAREALSDLCLHRTYEWARKFRIVRVTKRGKVAP